MATIGSAKATLVNKIDSLTSSATAKDTIFLAKALKENTTHHSFTFLGAWAASTAYALDDVVTTSGNTYICILGYTSGSSFAVGSNWSLMAEKGTDGSNGASGIPSGGSLGQVVTNTGAGTGDWADTSGGTLCSFLLTGSGTSTWYAHTGSLAMNSAGGSGHLTGFTISGNAVVVPEAGKYAFICNIYTGWSDSNNNFRFLVNGGALNGATGGNLHYQDLGDNSNDRTITHSIILDLASGDAITLEAIGTSDWYSGHSHWAGFKIN